MRRAGAHSKKEIVEIARRVVAGEIDPLEGCRAIVGRRSGLSDEEMLDPDFVTLVAIESETDDLPLGSVRSLWAPSALADADRRRAAILSSAKRDLLQACGALIEKLSAASPVASMPLFEQFLKKECTESERQRIRSTILHRDPMRERQELVFSQFEVVLDFGSGTATVRDRTDATARGSVSVGFTELLDTLRQID